MINRLAILPDSPRQMTDNGNATPALQMFQDPVHVLARDYKLMYGDLRVVILSTKFGLVDEAAKLSVYNKAINFDLVDRQLRGYQLQWQRNGERWMQGVNDVFIGLTGAYLYVPQRLELMITLPALPQVKRVVVGNVAPYAQFLNWLDAPLGSQTLLLQDEEDFDA